MEFYPDEVVAGRVDPATIADHIHPHRGDLRLGDSGLADGAPRDPWHARDRG
jgi:hypothetical protein